jgi:hypothetical protein
MLDPVGRATWSTKEFRILTMIYRSLLEEVSKLETKSPNERVLVKSIQALLQRAIAEDEARAAKPLRTRDAMEDQD